MAKLLNGKLVVLAVIGLVLAGCTQSLDDNSIQSAAEKEAVERNAEAVDQSSNPGEVVDEVMEDIDSELNSVDVDDDFSDLNDEEMGLY